MKRRIVKKAIVPKVSEGKKGNYRNKYDPDITWRYSTQELEEVNVDDLLDSIKKDRLVGLVDEEVGGIVAYIFKSESKRIEDILNDDEDKKSALKKKAVKKRVIKKKK